MWANKAIRYTGTLLLGALLGPKAYAGMDAPSKDSTPVVIEKLYAEFWFEPDEQTGVVLKFKEYKECLYPQGGSEAGLHSYFFNPFISVTQMEAHKIAANGKKTGIYYTEKLDYRKPGIVYSESQQHSYRFPDLLPGERTSSTIVYSFRESRNIIPVYYGEIYPIRELKVVFHIPPGIDVNPGFFRCDSADFRIARIKNKKDNTLEITRADVPPIDRKKQKEAHSSYYSPFIYFKIKGGTVFDTPVYSLADIDDLYAYNLGYTKMVPPSDTARLRQTTDTLVSADRPERENMERIFNWVKDNIQYVAIMEGKKMVVPEPASSVLFSKYGDCKGMTSLLKGLAEAAHIPVHYGWVGTHNISYQPSQVPIPFAFDHMVGIYISGADTLVLDATGKYSYMGEVSPQLYGKEVMVALGDATYALYKIPTPAPAENKLEMDARYYLSETNWSADYSARLEGHKKTLFNYVNKTPAGSFEKNRKPNPIFMEMDNPKSIVYNIEENNRQNVHISWQQPLDNGVVKMADSWLINPYPAKYKDLLGIDTEERESPVEVEFPFQDRMTFSVEIPEGYELGSPLPETAYTSDLGSIRCQTHQNGRTLVAEFSLVLKPQFIYPADFKQFNLFKDTLKKCISEYIVFNKKQ